MCTYIVHLLINVLIKGLVHNIVFKKTKHEQFPIVTDHCCSVRPTGTTPNLMILYPVEPLQLDWLIARLLTTNWSWGEREERKREREAGKEGKRNER